MKYKATEKFKELGIENSYQGLLTEDYYKLRNGGIVEIEFPPKHLIDGNYIKELKSDKKKEG